MKRSAPALVLLTASILLSAGCSGDKPSSTAPSPAPTTVTTTVTAPAPTPTPSVTAATPPASTPTPVPTPTPVSVPMSVCPEAAAGVPTRPGNLVVPAAVPSSNKGLYKLYDNTQAAACTFARWWDYEAPTWARPSILQVYTHGKAICTQKRRQVALGQKPLNMVAAAQKLGYGKDGANALAKAATQALCSSHHVVVTTPLDRQALLVKTTINETPSFYWYNEPGPQVHAYGYFLKRTCDVLASNPLGLHDILVHEAATDQLELLSYDKQPGADPTTTEGLGYDTSSLQLFVKKSVLYGCKNFTSQLNQDPFWSKPS